MSLEYSQIKEKRAENEPILERRFTRFKYGFALLQMKDEQRTFCNFEDSEKLIGTHIFRFGKNPTVVEKDITFITIQVHTDKSINSWTRIVPQIEITIYSHDNHMNLDTKIFPNVTANRNDYISEWFDNKLNGVTKIGSFNLTSKLKLKRNHEYSYTKPDWMMRNMIFEGEEMSIDLCAEMNKHVDE